MKLKIPSILMLCVMCAVLLSGCTISISPASPGTSSDTAVQSRPETEESPSSGDLATPAPTASPQVAQSTEVPAESSAISSVDGTSSDEKTPSSASSSEKRNENSAESTAASANNETSESDDDFVYYESLEDFPELNLSIDETGNSLCKDGVGWFAAPGLWQISGEMVSDGRIIGIKILYEGNPEDFTWQFFDSTDLSITFPQCYEIDLSNKEIERIDHRTIYFAGGDTLSF